MQPFELRKDTLLEIATFLARRWSGVEDISIDFSEKNQAKTWLKEKKITLLPFDKYQGSDFEKYRQFRVSLWYEAIRIKHCKKILSNDHAFGFILNTIETKRVELLGRKTWRGMDNEIIFNYAYALNYRPQLGSLYGKARIVEAFYQAFLFGGIKGEIQYSNFEKIQRAVQYANKIIEEVSTATAATAENNIYQTEWIEKKIPEIIKILDIDSLLTIPMSLPWMKQGMALTQKEILQTLIKISKNKEGDFGKIDPKAALQGAEVFNEYKVLVEENKKNENKGLGVEPVGVKTPSTNNVDETRIYDADLINKLKTKFKDWKSGWKEHHLRSGDEFDEESYIDRIEPFFTDVKKTIKAKIVILLDHSSSISAEQTEYKKATLALCEVLAYLQVNFSVYAFSTENRTVVCWLIKPENLKWNYVSAKRLAQIIANGSTPLAEVYDKMFPAMQSTRPEIFLTLTDGEPSDPNAVVAMLKSLKSIGIKMVALGFGPNTIRATTIASNLKTLGYEKTLAVSRLEDIPNKVLGILEQG